jgi:hypothetical protein
MVLVSGAAVRIMFLSTMPAVSPTVARVGSVSITVLSVALSQGAVLNEEHTVFELPVVEQALLHNFVSLHGGSHLKEEGPVRLATPSVLICQERQSILTLDCREGFWDSMFEMDLASSFLATLLTLTEWAMTMNRCPWTHSLLGMTVVCVVSCSTRAFVEGVSAVTRISLLPKVLAAMTLPGLPALALLMASTTRVLGCSGAASLVIFTITTL